MNKTIMGIAFAFILGAGAGYGVYASMAPQSSTQTADAAQTSPAPEEVANVEPAAADAKIDVKKPIASADNPVVARVNDQEILRSDVKDFMKSLPPQMSQIPMEQIFPMVLEQVVNAKIVDEKVKSNNVINSPEYTQRLDDAKIQIGRAVYAEQQIEKKFSESAVKKAYNEIVSKMPKTDEVKARHILVEDEAKAKEVIAKLEGGAKFEDLAKEFSKDQSNSASGGDLGYFAKADMVKEFGDAAFAMSKGAYSKAPVKTQFGYHIIQVEDKRERPAPSFDEMKGQLEGQVRRQILEDLVKDWRKNAKVETFDMDGKPVQNAEAKSDGKPADEQKAAN